jgi:hypothetical protein
VRANRSNTEAGQIARRRRRRRITVALAATAALGMSGIAEALSISRFRAYATSSAVHYAIHYCDRAARLHEHYEFFALDGPSGDFTDDGYTRVHGGCYVLTGHFPNQYNGGLWELKLTMSDSRGALLHRAAKVYLP